MMVSHSYVPESFGALFIRKSEEASCKTQKIATESALRDA